MCRKKPKARQFFLFNDILVYGNIVINKKKYNKQHIIPLEEVKLESLEDDNRMLQMKISEKKCMHFVFRVSEWLVNQNSFKVFCCLCGNCYRKTGMDGTY